MNVLLVPNWNYYINTIINQISSDIKLSNPYGHPFMICFLSFSRIRRILVSAHRVGGGGVGRDDKWVFVTLSLIMSNHRSAVRTADASHAHSPRQRRTTCRWRGGEQLARILRAKREKAFRNVAPATLKATACNWTQNPTRGPHVQAHICTAKHSGRNLAGVALAQTDAVVTGRTHVAGKFTQSGLFLGHSGRWNGLTIYDIVRVMLYKQPKSHTMRRFPRKCSSRSQLVCLVHELFHANSESAHWVSGKHYDGKVVCFAVSTS